MNTAILETVFVHKLNFFDVYMYIGAVIFCIAIIIKEILKFSFKNYNFLIVRLKVLLKRYFLNFHLSLASISR